jgi:hypothetical protein
MGGQVFYVGKGQGERINDHEQEAGYGTPGQRYDIIRAIWTAGYQVVKSKVLETENQTEALSEERRLIYRHGLDNLTNQAGGSGGRPSIGLRVRTSFVMTEEMDRAIQTVMQRYDIPLGQAIRLLVAEGLRQEGIEVKGYEQEAILNRLTGNE